MKQALQFRLGQSLTMTPQLQQAIRLLQLSTLELNTEIQDALDSNMMLESGDDADNTQYENTNAPATENTDIAHNETSNETNLETSSDIAASATTMPDDLHVDTSWDDIYDSILPGTTSAATSSTYNADDQPEVYTASSESLHEKLRWQIKMTPFSEVDAAIAEVIVDEINDDGFLQTTVEEITATLESLEVEVDEVDAVLRQIQNFDPAGVGSRDLGECMSIQLRQFSPETAWRDQAIRVVTEHLELLAGHDYNQLMRRMKLNEDDMQHVVKLIRSLNPRPGSHLSSKRTEYIVPDVYVRKHKGIWRVELNTEVSPKLRINDLYANMIRRADNSKDNTFLKNNLQEARWLLKSLQSRNETLLKVSTCIVEHQRGFLEHGEEAMKAFVLR